MKTYGYIRVSSLDQNLDRQIISMSELKIPPENIFTDKQSGKNTARPGLQKLLKIIKRGDTIIVESVSRFARNTRDLLDLIEKLRAKGVEFISQKEQIDTTTAGGKFMLTVFGAMAEWERDIIRQRQSEGIKAARAKGVHLGRPVKKPPENFREIIREWERGKMMTKTALELTGLSESTFYRRCREIQSSRKK